MSYIKIYVYRDNNLGDCTNNGASSKYNELYLFSEGHTAEEIAETADFKGINIEQCFKVETIWKGQPNEYKRAIPVLRKTNMAGPMMGGNYGMTCDSRYKEVTGGLRYPIAILDRYETHEDCLLND